MNAETIATADDFSEDRDGTAHISLLWLELGLDGIEATPPEHYTEEELAIAAQAYTRGRCERTYLDDLRHEQARDREEALNLLAEQDGCGRPVDIGHPAFEVF